MRTAIPNANFARSDADEFQRPPRSMRWPLPSQNSTKTGAGLGPPMMTACSRCRPGGLLLSALPIGCHKRQRAIAANVPLFDHLVGAGEQRRRQKKPSPATKRTSGAVGREGAEGLLDLAARPAGSKA